MDALTLYNAIFTGDVNSINGLLSQGVDVNIKPPNDASKPWELSPLREAIVEEQPGLVRLLLEAGADPNGEYALLMAVHEGYKDAVPLLLEYGADPNTKDDEGSVPLKEAARNGDLDSVKALLDAGAYIEYSGGTDGISVLGAAAINGHIDVVRYLIDSGANIIARDSDYSTVLDLLHVSSSWNQNQLPETKNKREAVVQLIKTADGKSPNL